MLPVSQEIHVAFNDDENEAADEPSTANRIRGTFSLAGRFRRRF
jgi:hypothetical protein